MTAALRRHPAAHTRWAVQFTGVGGETVVQTRNQCGVPFVDDVDAAAHACHLHTVGRCDAHVVYQTSGTTTPRVRKTPIRATRRHVESPTYSKQTAPPTSSTATRTRSHWWHCAWLAP